MKRRIIIAAFFVLLISCTKYIELTLPSHEPRLVLHGYVETGGLFEVSIGRSTSPNEVLSGNDTYVLDARVALYENDVFKDSLKYNAQEKRYVSQSVIAVAGRTYKIIAAANGFAAIEAVAKASMPVETVSVIHDKKTRNTSYGDWLDDVRFSLRDPGGEKNYYFTALYPSYWSRRGLGCVYTNEPAIERIQSESLPFEESECMEHDEILFSDRSFNGMVKEITISASSDGLLTEPDSLGNLHRPYIKRFAVSEEYYKYLKTTLSMYVGGEIPSLADPVAIKGNVKNGYGLLAVYSVATDTLR